MLYLSQFCLNLSYKSLDVYNSGGGVVPNSDVYKYSDPKAVILIEFCRVNLQIKGMEETNFADVRNRGPQGARGEEKDGAPQKFISLHCSRERSPDSSALHYIRFSSILGPFGYMDSHSLNR